MEKHDERRVAERPCCGDYRCPDLLVAVEPMAEPGSGLEGVLEDVLTLAVLDLAHRRGVLPAAVSAYRQAWEVAG